MGCPLPRTPVHLFIGLILSDDHFGRHLGCCLLDGTTNFLHSLASLYHPSLTNSDCQRRPRPGVTLPLTFHLLHVDRDYFGVAGTCGPGDCYARCLGSNLRHCDSRLIVQISRSPESSTYRVWFSSPLGGVEVAVAIIMCNMSIIIPAILRALGIGDPFMQEDTVDPKSSTGVEIGLSSAFHTSQPIQRA